MCIKNMQIDGFSCKNKFIYMDIEYGYSSIIKIMKNNQFYYEFSLTYLVFGIYDKI